MSANVTLRKAFVRGQSEELSLMPGDTIGVDIFIDAKDKDYQGLVWGLGNLTLTEDLRLLVNNREIMHFEKDKIRGSNGLKYKEFWNISECKPKCECCGQEVPK